jgi:hypothetical protein
MSITTQQEAVMSKAIPAQHPAVVLRSRYRQLRALLAVMVVAVVGLSTTVVVLSIDDQTATTATTTHLPTASKPDESAIAASISQAGSRSYPTLDDPFQSRVEQPRPQGGVEESNVAAAIGSQPSPVSAPDEARIAASLAKHSDVGPAARSRAWQQKLDSMTPQEQNEAFVNGH